MKQNINEIHRMQQLAGILKENQEMNNSSVKESLYVEQGNVNLEFGIQTEEGVRLLNEVLGDENIGYITNLTTEIINKLLSSPLYPKIAEEAKKAMNALSGIEQDLKEVRLSTDYTFILDDEEEINKKDGPIAILEYSYNTFDDNEDDYDQFKDYLESKGFNVTLHNDEIATFIVD
jgi:hypothetical protein